MTVSPAAVEYKFRIAIERSAQQRHDLEKEIMHDADISTDEALALVRRIHSFDERVAG